MTVKKASTKDKTQKSSSTPEENRNPSKTRRVLVWGAITFAKVLFILVFFLVIYSIYLDGKVRNKFEGQRWEVPIQVYGKAEAFKRSQAINLAILSSSLQFSGYKRVSKVTKAGEYALSGSRIVVYRRAFSFDNDMQVANKVQIDVSNGRVSKIYIDNQSVSSVRMEPVLMDRILPSSKEDRVLTPIGDVPVLLLDTLLLVEDRNFYFHKGISPLGILRALYSNILAGRTVQGGSTLTQQLVKNMFLTRDKTLWRKANEAIMSLILEYRYSKDLLLEAYINEVYLGQNYANAIHGFGLAAEFYFGQRIEQLTAEQMAMLVGIVKGPSYYDPWRKPNKTKARRDLVLKLMFEKEFLTKAEFVQAIESPLTVRKARRFSRQKFPSYVQLVKQELAELMTEYDQKSGISVFTGFSHYSQQMLEQTIEERLPKLDTTGELQAAMVVSDIKSGEIKAIVGGKKSGYAGFNRAINSNRPIGSLVKPAIYLAALERYEQYSLATVLEDKPITLTSDEGTQWSPKNYDGKYREKVNLIDALVESLNIPTVNLGMAIGLTNIADTLHVLGFDKDITVRPSMLLGSINMSPVEVNQFYLPIASNGFSKQGHTITRITSSQDVTLFEFKAIDTQLFSSQASYLLDYALSEVTKRGTAKSLTWRLKGKEILGKTGTTNDQRDSWFVGFDNQHLVTSWVGLDDNKPTKLTGSSGALVLFADYMNKQGVIDKELNSPERIELVTFEKETGNAVSDDCSETILLPANSNSLQKLETCSSSPVKKLSWLDKLFGN
ncbi:penicillin-binding protein 1B [Pseudocolwellia agarivorans]|uniref:penicillin-binding protein 1B n=1 Tax=Pseudocolwellia agarivorans TaxID=1911682 RepID=UPI000987628C|nr:penicillin-binding protein 1B [Pseudocolwellia agarivorans]